MESQPLDNQPDENKQQIKLLAERLNVKRHRQKVGEVVIRKETETHTIEVPIRQEKLIIEKVGSETERLAEIDLGESRIIEQTPEEMTLPTVQGNFPSLQTAIAALSAIARENPQSVTQVTVKLILEDVNLQSSYEAILQRYIE